MKNLILMTLFSMLILIFGGCQSSNSTTSDGETAQAGENEEKIYQVDELAKTVAADEQNWIGKEVTATGRVSGKPGKAGKKYTVIAKTAEHNDFRTNCDAEGEIPEGLLDDQDGWKFKGKIYQIKDEKRVYLRPCEVIKK